MDDITYFCEKCFASTELIQLVAKKGTHTSKCKVCSRENVLVLSPNDEDLRRTFRALIRFHYSEWDYNEHLGGDHLSRLLFGKNPILNLDQFASEEDFQDGLSVITTNWYPEDADQISLGGDFETLNTLFGIKRKLSMRANALSRSAYTSNYFDLLYQTKSMLKPIEAYISQTLAPDNTFVRARIGVSKIGADYSGISSISKSNDPNRDYYFKPYSGNEMGAPPLHLCSEGRLNRPRVSILYLATDIQTAVAEVRPHPGHLVSTCKFVSKEEVRFADFTIREVANFLSDLKLELLREIISIDTLLNLPVPPEDRRPYLVTQLLSDGIRELGFDGIKFSSSVGPGKNFVCFHPSKFSPIPASDLVSEVKGLNYSIVDKPLIGRDIPEDELQHLDSSPLELFTELLERNYQLS